MAKKQDPNTVVQAPCQESVSDFLEKVRCPIVIGKKRKTKILIKFFSRLWTWTSGLVCIVDSTPLWRESPSEMGGTSTDVRATDSGCSCIPCTSTTTQTARPKMESSSRKPSCPSFPLNCTREGKSILQLLLYSSAVAGFVVVLNPLPNCTTTICATSHHYSRRNSRATTVFAW